MKLKHMNEEQRRLTLSPYHPAHEEDRLLQEKIDQLVTERLIERLMGFVIVFALLMLLL
jgi:hypothetical protein